MPDRSRAAALFLLPFGVAVPIWAVAGIGALLLPDATAPGCLTSPAGAFGDGVLWSGAVCGGVAGGVALLPLAVHLARGRTDLASFLRLAGAAAAACVVPIGALLFVIDLLVVPVGRFRCWRIEADEVVLVSAFGERRVARDDVADVLLGVDAEHRTRELVLRLADGEQVSSVPVPERLPAAFDEARAALISP